VRWWIAGPAPMLAPLLALAGACSYDAAFRDCEIECTDATGCPSGFSCGSQGLCRPTGVTAATCRLAACDGGPVDVLANGDFDAIDLPWRQEPATPSLLCGEPLIRPDSGAFAACLGAGGDNSVKTLSRDIPLPAGAVSARLAGRLCIATAETQGPDRDVLDFDILAGDVAIGPLGRRANQQGAATCDYASFTLDAPLTADPVTATFRIRSTLDVGESTSFFLDSLVLTVACR